MVEFPFLPLTRIKIHNALRNIKRTSVWCIACPQLVIHKNDNNNLKKKDEHKGKEEAKSRLATIRNNKKKTKM